MAKRRRLDPAPFLGGASEDDSGAAFAAGFGTSDLSRAKEPGDEAPLRTRAPIAQMAGGAAAAAALDEVSATLRDAREEGRLVLRLPIGAVVTDHLARDRLAAESDPSRRVGMVDREAMAELKASLAARGQQAPVEVVELPPQPDGSPRWGLISGWRRLTALRALRQETGEERFATVLALVRRPATAAEAYVAMVEENEVRADLSFWERARIVRRAVEAGAFPGETEALRGLFAAASYARRSKIKSFLPVVAALDDAIAFPTAIGERLGLALARALAEEPGFAERARAGLAAARPSDAATEGIILSGLVTGFQTGGASPEPPIPRASAPASPPGGVAQTSRPRSPDGPTQSVSSPPPGDAAVRDVYTEMEIGPVTLRTGAGFAEVTGPGVTALLTDRLEEWLRTQL